MPRPRLDQADDDFTHARQRAILRDFVARIGGRTNDLVPYRDVRRRVSPEGEQYRGVRSVPVDAIVGSTDRFRDFDRAFLPRRAHTRGRWTSIDRAYYEDKVLPPVQLYKVGDVYFVKDGNHRVSVARDRGQAFIDAEVTEGRVRAPLCATMSPEELLLQAEYAEFLRRTDLDHLRPEHDLRPSDLGRYEEIWEHVLAHQRWLEEEFERRPVGLEEAVIRWYDRVYAPIVGLAREQGLTRAFPGRTDTDVYLWIMRRRDELYDRYRRTREPYGAAAEQVAAASADLGWRAGLSAGRSLLRRPATRSSARRRRVAPLPESGG